MKIIALLTVLMILTAAVLAFGVDKSQDPFTVITSEELMAMIDRHEAGLVVIDTRTPEEFQEVHIERAVNITLPELGNNPATLTFAKDAKLVFYCNGFSCGNSRKVARLAASLSYRNLYVLNGGLPSWEEKGFAVFAGADYEKRAKMIYIPPKDLQAMLAGSQAAFTLVDVRDAEEYAEGHIRGAVNIPIDQFAVGANILEKNKQIIVYCKSGGRSYNAYRKLKKMGYTNIAQAIYDDWQEAGLPVLKGTLK